jgi:DNA-binding NarL/FixJ family response regulator
VLILCELPDDELMVQALQLGAKGCLSKTLSQEDLTRAIRATYNGEIWAERKVVTRALEGLRRKVHGVSASLEKTQDILTAREQEVVKWAIRGMTNKEIAAHLGISDKTVKTHLGSVFNKLKISRRSELIRRGMVE